LVTLVNAGYAVLAVVAVLFSLVGAYYYLRVIRVMYFDAPPQDAPPIALERGVGALLSVNALTVALLGLFPGGLLQLTTLTLFAPVVHLTRF
jgi:NADH-quinone oxidoreductase subunit N